VFLFQIDLLLSDEAEMADKRDKGPAHFFNGAG
jgi:hypothetical protein